MGVSPGHRRIHSENDGGQFQAVRQVSALCIQLQRCEPLPFHEGILSSRFRSHKTTCERGEVVSSGFVHGRGRCEHAQRRNYHSANSLRKQLVSERIGQGQRRVYVAGLFWISPFAADDPCALGREGFLNTETGVGIVCARRRAGFNRENASGHSVQCGRVGGTRRRERAGRIESRRLCGRNQ